MKTYKLVFTQNDSIFEVSVKSDNKDIGVIAGTLSNKVVKFLELIRRHKNVIPFAFNRKFDVAIVFEGNCVNTLEGVSFNGEDFQVKLTLINNDKSKLRFNSFMRVFVMDALTTLGSDEEVHINELVELYSDN